MPASTSMITSFEQYINSRRELIDTNLDKYLKATAPELLYQSMRYSVLSQGKRIRALLCLAAAETIASIDSGAQKINYEKPDPNILDQVMPTACAIEMIHAMSLIHDDLPCLDNDDLRRGCPTNHKVFGEAIALLAGDALLMQAVETILEFTPAQVDTSVITDVVKGMTRATGPLGMVGGQVFDLIYTGQFSLPEKVDQKMIDQAIATGTSIETNERNRKVDEAVVQQIHSRKTGALISFSLWSGAKLSNASDQQLEGVHKFGQLLGLAFQIADDLLDVTGNKETLGKTPGKDQAEDKTTWIKIFGIEQSKAKLAELKSEGEEILTNYHLRSEDFSMLLQLLDFAITRNR